LGPRPLSEDATVLIDESLREQDDEDNYKIIGWSLSIRCLWQSSNSVKKWRTYLFDDSLSEKRRDDILFTLMDSPLEQNEIKVELMKFKKTKKLPLNIQHTILLLLIYLGDKTSTIKAVDILSELSDDNLLLLAAIIGKNSPDEIITRFTEKLTEIALSSNQKGKIASYLAGSMNWDIIIKNSRSWFGMRRRLSPPSLFVCSQLIDKWLSDYDGDLKGYLTLLNAGSELGLKRAPLLLAERLTQIVFKEPKLFKEFDFDHVFSRGLDFLNDFRETRSLLSLEVLKRCVEISTSNTAYRALSMIASFANEKALDTLLHLHQNKIENKDSLEPYIEELSGRLGIRIVRDNDNLARE